MRDEWPWVFAVPANLIFAHHRAHEGTQRLFAVPANRDLFPLEVWEEKEDIQSVIEPVFLSPPMDRMDSDGK